MEDFGLMIGRFLGLLLYHCKFERFFSDQEFLVHDIQRYFKNFISFNKDRLEAIFLIVFIWKMRSLSLDFEQFQCISLNISHNSFQFNLDISFIYFLAVIN